MDPDRTAAARRNSIDRGIYQRQAASNTLLTFYERDEVPSASSDDTSTKLRATLSSLLISSVTNSASYHLRGFTATYNFTRTRTFSPTMTEISVEYTTVEALYSASVVVTSFCTTVEYYACGYLEQQYPHLKMSLYEPKCRACGIHGEDSVLLTVPQAAIAIPTSATSRKHSGGESHWETQLGHPSALSEIQYLNPTSQASWSSQPSSLSRVYDNPYATTSDPNIFWDSQPDPLLTVGRWHKINSTLVITQHYSSATSHYTTYVVSSTPWAASLDNQSGDLEGERPLEPTGDGVKSAISESQEIDGFGPQETSYPSPNPTIVIVEARGSLLRQKLKGIWLIPVLVVGGIIIV